MHGERRVPPLISPSWLEANADRLSELQREGRTCVYCGEEPAMMVPVGRLASHQLWACFPACGPAYGLDRR